MGIEYYRTKSVSLFIMRYGSIGYNHLLCSWKDKFGASAFDNHLSFLVETVLSCKGIADRRNVKWYWHFRLEGLTAAFHKFSRTSKIGVFRPHSPTSHLPYSPFCPQGIFARKMVFPTKRLKGASQEGKELKPKNEMIMRVRRMTIEQDMGAGLSHFPNFHKTGSVRGMRKLYYGSKYLLVHCGNYIYNVSSEAQIYYQATF